MIPHVDKEHIDKQEDVLQLDEEYINASKWYDQILLNRPLKVIILLLLASVLAPLLIYRFLFFESLDMPPSDGFSIGSCLVPRLSRLTCGKGNVTAEECHQQCCYDLDNHICFHRYPSRFSYLMDFPWTEDISLQPRVATVPYNFQNSIRSIRLSVDEISSTHLSLSFYNAADKTLTGRRLADKDYTYDISSPELNVIVSAEHGNVFNTIRGPLIASNDIWEIAFTLSEEAMYGFGQIPIREDTYHVIYNHAGMNSIPLIFAKSNGSYHGLLIDVTEPTEVYFGRDHQIVVRSITNFGLKFHVFVGPKPVDVMKDVRTLLGGNEQLEYWMLGVHVCSETTGGVEALTNLNTFIAEAATHNMPFESHCGTTPVVLDSACDSSLFDNIDAGASVIKNSGRRFVPHVSPYILYNVPLEIPEESNDTESRSLKDAEVNTTCSNLIHNYKDYILRDPNNDIYAGLVNNSHVIYPDYENISEEFIKILWKSTSTLDGVVLENNWPLDESWTHVNETGDYLPYWNEHFSTAFNNTPQWNATRPNGERYLYSHNTYGNHFSKAFEHVSGPLPTWSSNQWMGKDVVNRQDIPTSWSSLHKELIEAALGGVSGQWLWSSPICGDTRNFHNETHTSVCIKWYMAATYMPMIKIHSKNTTRDPLAFAGTNKMLMITALNRRMSLLPYFYTVLQEGPLLRPMFFQYPDSDSLMDLTNQFNVGDSILMVPNLQPMQSHVHISMPPGTWFEFWSGLRIEGEEGEAVTMTTTEADFLTLLKGGSIIAMQKNINSTADQTRLLSDFSITVALDCVTTNITEEEETKNVTECHASGHVYMNDNMTIVFEADDEQLRITAKGEDFDVLCNDEAIWAHKVTELNVYGLSDTLNNYDHQKLVSTDIDLCELVDSEIVFPFHL